MCVTSFWLNENVRQLRDIAVFVVSQVLPSHDVGGDWTSC